MIPICITTDVPMRDELYYRIGGRARFLAKPETLREIQEVILWCNRESIPYVAVGSGTNLIFSDRDFEGLVLSLERFASAHWIKDDLLYAEGGVANTDIAKLALEKNRSQAAWMHRLPGQIGATVRMNARCFSGEISQIVESVLCVDHKGRLHSHSGNKIFRGYKDTTLMTSSEIVVAVLLKLPASASAETIAEEMDRHLRERTDRHHFDYPSCGSTFKNNYTLGISSGKIFEELGFKGKRHGGAQVSPHHANFIYNIDNASAQDVLELAAEMRDAAQSRHGVELDLEVEPVGEFEPQLLKRCGLLARARAHSESASTTGGRLAYCGLTWAPGFPEPPPTFPVSLFSAPFLHYFRQPDRGISGVTATLEQLRSLSCAAKDPDAPFLRWTTELSGNAFSLFHLTPEASAGEFLDELWVYSVSEIFLGHPTLPRYHEFEITPLGHWIAIDLVDRRKRAPGHDKPAAKYWPGVRTFTNGHAFGMELSYRQVEGLIDDNSISMQCCLSLGDEQYLLAPHWKDNRLEPRGTWDEGEPPEAKADFHQPHRYWKITLTP
jgi:UDP-N-acetylmuramate dehydrogenase